ncbi:MAG: TIGR03915 family putative DNA repair protein [Defluviitaleaceae bacterium]|nr:TIGR03915 family putative DNA repair protein [Defluviitaleaceae bacterium]
MAGSKQLAVTFDGSFEGFLSILYAYYYDRIVPAYIQSEDEYQQTLDTEEFHISTDIKRAAQVLKGIQQKISLQSEDYLTYAFLAEEDDDSRFMDMFRYTLLGFKVGHMVDSHLHQDYVLGVHKRARYVGKEAHLLTGFCRFAETKQGVFYSSITPNNDVLPILAEHFSDRMMNQAWIIHDKKRHQAAIYDGKKYAIGDVPKSIQLEYSENEEQIQALWGAFFDSVTIKERINKNLQRNMIPLRYRGNMLEFSLTKW